MGRKLLIPRRIDVSSSKPVFLGRTAAGARSLRGRQIRHEKAGLSGDRQIGTSWHVFPAGARQSDDAAHTAIMIQEPTERPMNAGDKPSQASWWRAPGNTEIPKMQQNRGALRILAQSQQLQVQECKRKRIASCCWLNRMPQLVVAFEEVPLSTRFPSGGVVPLTKTRKTWIAAAVIALVSCFGELATHLVANDMHEALKPYAWIPWVVFALSLVTAVLAAIQEVRGKRAASAVPLVPKMDRSLTVSGSVSGVVNTGDSNSIVQVRTEHLE